MRRRRCGKCRQWSLVAVAIGAVLLAVLLLPIRTQLILVAATLLVLGILLLSC